MIIYFIPLFLIIFGNFISCKYSPELIENENLNLSLLYRIKRADIQICRQKYANLYEIFMIRDVYLNTADTITKDVVVFKSLYDKRKRTPLFVSYILDEANYHEEKMKK
jgi:hypothetical protein